MDELTKHLRPVSQVRLFKKGMNILFQGEIPQKAYIIRSGVVRAYTINSSGEEAIPSFFAEGDIFPISWVTGTTNHTLFYYDAVSDVRVMAVSKSDFMEYVTNNKDLLQEIMTYLSKQYTSSMLRITGLEQSRAIEKIVTHSIF